MAQHIVRSFMFRDGAEVHWIKQGPLILPVVKSMGSYVLVATPETQVDFLSVVREVLEQRKTDNECIRFDEVEEETADVIGTKSMAGSRSWGAALNRENGDIGNLINAIEADLLIILRKISPHGPH